MPPQAARSNGLFGQVGHVLGVSTNGAPPCISGLEASPADARTDAAHLSVSLDTPGVACKVWYTLHKITGETRSEVVQHAAEEIWKMAQSDSVIDLPKVCGRARSEREVPRDAARMGS